MNTLVPAANIQAAYVAGLAMIGLQHALSAYGYSLPPDIANGLSAFVTVLVAHAWDVLTAVPSTAAPAQPVK